MTDRATLQSAEAAGEPVPPTDALLGRTLDGRYKVEKLLGEGGMGIVYKAVHTTLGKPLAIKVLRPEVSKNEEILQRFRQEAQSASQVGNPHIIDISDFGTLSDGSTYFVMEFLTGQSLTAALSDSGGRFEVRRTVHVMRQLVEALGAAHDAGVVHRDLKPDNVQLIERSGQKDFVKILDFGIAKVSGSASKLTLAGQVFGTPHYMSPEQCAGNYVDHRTDIYALGAMLYEMTYGQVPFDAETLMGILSKHLYEAPKLPTPAAVALPGAGALEAIILKCLEKKPEARYQSMAELAHGLSTLEVGLASKAAIPVPSSRAMTGPQTLTGVEARVTLSGAAPDYKLRKNKAPLVAGLSMTASLIAVGAWLLLGQGPAQPERGAANAVSAKPAVAASASSALPPTAAAEPTMQADARAEAAAPTARLTVSSQPVHADVYLDNAMMGKTPYVMARPGRGQALTVELRLNGYLSKAIELNEASGDVELTLQKAAVRPAPAARSTKRSRTEPSTAKAAAPATKRSPTRAEVLDPWN